MKIKPVHATVGVATYHYSYNEGAILQAYATTEVLNSLSGVKGEIIDQRYPEKLRMYGEPDDDRKLALLQSIDQWLPLSQQQFRLSDLNPVYEYINSNYDKLIIGSDVVWNLKYKRYLRRFIPQGVFPRQAYPFFTPFPNIYWPSRKLEVPVYSYAAAIGTLEYKWIPNADRKRIKQSLQLFDIITVRDERTRRFVEFIDAQLSDQVVVVPDPTFGIDLDVSNIDILKEKLAGWGVDFSKPVCCFITSDHPALQKFANLLRRKGYQIVSLSTKNRLGDVDLFDKFITPQEWSVIFSLFDSCITERMHGAIFCLKNFVSFIALDINETTTDNDSKMVSLMRQFGKEGFVLPKSHLNVDSLNRLYTDLMSDKGGYMDSVSKFLPSARTTVRDTIERMVQA